MQRYFSTDCQGEKCNDTDRFGFIFADRATGEYLSAADGERIALRTLEFPSMDILQRQDAQPVVWIKRNEELVPHKPSADPFVYRTPNVEFTSAYHPTLDSEALVVI